MELKAVHERVLVGLKKDTWKLVYYQPIGDIEDLTKKDLAPEIGLFSDSRREAEEGGPMVGGVAFLPLFCRDFFESNVSAERKVMQQRLLWDAWRYLTAKNPQQIEVITAQLNGPESSVRQKVLLSQMEKSRKRKSRDAERRRRRRAANGLPAKTVGDASSSDSDDGYGSDGGAPMPPPPRPTHKLPVPNGGNARGLVSSQLNGLRASTEGSEGRGLFVTPRPEESMSLNDMTSDVGGRFTNHAALSRRTQSDSNSRRGKKRSNESSSTPTRNVRTHTDNAEWGRHGRGRALSDAPQSSGSSQQQDSEVQIEEGDFDPRRYPSPDGDDPDTGEHESDAGLRQNIRHEAFGFDDSAVAEFNGELDEEAAFNEARRMSMAPED